MNVATRRESAVRPPPQSRPIDQNRLAGRLAWREARGGLGPLRLLFVCLLLGVFALAGVGSLATAITKGLAAEGQTLLGGDVEARLTQRAPTGAERAALARFGVVSDSIRMRAMVRYDTAGDDRQLLAELKAVDARWPLYGTAQTAAGGTNAAVQAALGRGAVISQALAEQLSLSAGDKIAIGEARLPVTAILTHEPDRAGEGFTLGPSVLVALDILPATGLLQPGSLYRHHARVRLAPPTDPAQVIATLQQEFPDAAWRLTDRSDGAPGVRRFVERLAQFLTLVSLTALAVAGVGVGNAVASYLDRKGETIATLKILGAHAGLIMRAYLLLIGGVALAAAAAGALLGAMVPRLVSGLAGDALPVPPVAGFHIGPMLLAICFGLLVALAFAIVPLTRAADLPAQRIFRGRVERWPRPPARTLALIAGAGTAVVLLVVWQAHDRLLALGFLAGTGVVLLLLFGLGALIRAIAAWLPRPHGVLPRLALTNLHRPGALTRQLVVALGLGLSLFSCLAFIETSFGHELRRTVPEKAPTFFLLDLPKEDRDRFLAMMPANSDWRILPSLRGPITAVNDTPAASLDRPEGAWILRGDRGLTFATAIPEGNRVVAGQWWPADYSGEPLVSMDAEQAQLLGIGVGDTITVAILGVDITATIASLREIDWDSLGFNFALVFDPATLAGAPYSWMATISPPAADEAGFSGRMSRAFPTVSIIRVKDVVADVGRLLDQMGAAVRGAASVAILAGIAVLVGALAAQAKARTMDNVILKTLGATRRQLLLTAGLEYAALGTVVAIVALLIGWLSGWIIVRKVLEFGWHPDWPAVIATIACGAVLILVLGTVGAARTLGARIAPMLRES